ncbi:MAG: tagaturonate epimerase family protein [Termitinemataceae bacterium]
MIKLSRFSLGIGDRFGQEGRAQLAALEEAALQGTIITPVWNKSYREHSIIHTEPIQARQEADKAVSAAKWQYPYFVDADHIGLKTVDAFIPYCDFFTIDVADYIGTAAEDTSIQRCISQFAPYLGNLHLPDVQEPAWSITEETLYQIARKYLLAVQEAGKIYRHIAEKKRADTFVTEISMDETDIPQTPADLFFILGMLAHEHIPLQTIAPKFTGRFNKGVDYVGNVAQFELEFNEDISVIAFAVQEFDLPTNLKLSIHSGSDKFSLYPIIKKAVYTKNAGLHVKTAGTTWLEELIGLALTEGAGLTLAKEIYRSAYNRFDELCAPYAAVIDIHKDRLPSPDTVDRWSGAAFAAALRHVPEETQFNPDFRQLLHVGYKVAAELGNTYYKALEEYHHIIAHEVTDNLLQRHIKRIFMP